jgi:transcriptional regulator with XRE-family HTH domain
MSSNVFKSFRKQLKVLREAKGLKQHELETKIGKVQPGYISRVETGRIKTPPLRMQEKIASALEVSVSDLFFVEGLDDNAEALRARIHALAATDDVAQLRTFYRLMLVSREKYSK